MCHLILQVQNDQCQSTESESRWMKVSEKDWNQYRVWTCSILSFRIGAVSSLFLKHFQVDLTSGNNVLYWRTTSYALQGSAVKPVLLRNIQVSGTMERWCVKTAANFPGLSLLMIKCWCLLFLQGWPTLLSVSIVNLAPTARKQDLHAAPPALRIPTPTRVPPFAMSVKKTNTLVCLFAFSILCQQTPITLLRKYL